MNYADYGMGTAADFYYGKDLKDLDLAQISSGRMPNAPVTYDPYVYPEKASTIEEILF